MEWDKQAYDRFYGGSVLGIVRPEGEPPIRGTYLRSVMGRQYARIARYLIREFKLTSNSRVVVIGCGFGWTVEHLDEVCTAVGTDTSRYIQQAKHTTEHPEAREIVSALMYSPFNGRGKEIVDHIVQNGARSQTRVPILNEDSLTGHSIDRVKRVLGGDPTLVVTEDVLGGLDDDEVAELCTSLAGYGTNILHIVTARDNMSNPDTLADGLYWRTLMEYQQMVMGQQVINIEATMR